MNKVAQIRGSMKPFYVKNVLFGEGIPAVAIPVMEAEEDEILLRVRAAAKAGADVIEIRMDAWQPDLMSCGDNRSGNSQGGSAGLKGDIGSVGLKGDIGSAGLIGEQNQTASLWAGKRMNCLPGACGRSLLPREMQSSCTHCVPLRRAAGLPEARLAITGS